MYNIIYDQTHIATLKLLFSREKRDTFTRSVFAPASWPVTNYPADTITFGPGNRRS